MSEAGYKIALFPLAFLHAVIPEGRSILEHSFDKKQTKNWPGEHIDLSALDKYAGLQVWLEKADAFC